MKLTKIMAPTMQKAMAKVHKTLGLDAMIYSSHETEAGVEMIVGLPDAGGTGSMEISEPFIPNPVDQVWFKQIQNKLESLRENVDVMQQYLMDNLNDSRNKDKPKRAQLVTAHLQAKGFCGVLYDRLLTSYLDKQRVIRKIRKDVMQECLQENIPATPLDLINQKGCYAIIGTSGVGKTTAICKLARYFSSVHGSDKVGIITLDPQEVRVKSQLSHLCDHLQVELQYATDAQGFQTALQALAPKTIVLIDTFGCSPRQEKSLETLRTFFKKKSTAIQVYLALPCNLQNTVYEQLHAAFNEISLSGAILTKLDEADNIAPVLSQIVKLSLPLAHIGTLQEITTNYPDFEVLIDKLYPLDTQM